MQQAKQNGRDERYLTVGQAATLLGVSRSTLRNWDRGDKLKASRNPINGYRMYRRTELENLLNRIQPR
jgi:excisionase family DNA binding protein